MYPTTRADVTNISDLRAAADIIEEKDALTTYLGFCKPGTTETSAPDWSIMRIQASGTAKPIIHSFMWADGLCSFSHAWNNRLAYTYKFKNF